MQKKKEGGVEKKGSPRRQTRLGKAASLRVVGETAGPEGPPAVPGASARTLLTRDAPARVRSAARSAHA